MTLQGVEVAGGPALTVLAFVAADAADAGEAQAVREVEAMGWREVAALRSGEVVDESALPDDFRGALATARRYGCGLIIYDEP